MPPPKVTASCRVRASGAHRGPPDTVLTFQKSSLLPPDHNTTTAANSRDSAKLRAGTMTQTQSSVLSPNFNTSWLWSQECQVWRTELCFWNNAFISPCTVLVWISGNSHTIEGGETNWTKFGVVSELKSSPCHLAPASFSKDVVEHLSIGFLLSWVCPTASHPVLYHLPVSPASVPMFYYFSTFWSHFTWLDNRSFKS